MAVLKQHVGRLRYGDDVVVVVVVVVLTFTDGYNAVRGHRTGSNNSGVEDYRRKTNKNRR